ncbi:NAC domain-containing protein 1-like [Cicer arietinum]|uniref:NAC domain-containing protein 1-like n=1 Tax=Cicer arietinum TaxID=3827 RepID=A0A1S3EK77_CICAR|nr:NAC domain-containing protein 1-like [Cicer arietinum]
MYKREGEQHTYFFTKRNRKYPKGERPDRGVRGFGFWKATGIDHPINDNGTIIGFKKTLVFYRGNPKGGDKTNWIMQEYTINIENIESTSTTPTSQLNNWVICKIYEHKRGDAIGKAKKRKHENENLEGENMEEVIPTPNSSPSTPLTPTATSPPLSPSTPPTPAATSPPPPLLPEMSSNDIDMANFQNGDYDISSILNFDQNLENEMFDIDQLLDS